MLYEDLHTLLVKLKDNSITIKLLTSVHKILTTKTIPLITVLILNYKPNLTIHNKNHQ